MKMELPFRCHYWSVLQVVIIVTCHGEKASSDKVQGCVGSELSLKCPGMKVIQITSVVLGDSNCLGTLCCIKDNNCFRNANAGNTMDVHHRCDKKQSCTVDVPNEKIPCGWFGSSYNDFERITYNCIDEPRNATMNNSTTEEPTEGEKYPDSKQDLVTEIAQSCVGSHLTLKCEETKVIRILDVVIGNLNGVRRPTVCSISYSNCTHDANADHTMDVQRKCDGQNRCTVDVVQEKISCGTLGSTSLSDFELIAYNCLNDSRNNFATTDGTVKNDSSTTEAGITNSKLVLIVVLSIICPVILLVIIIVAVVIYRRKERERVKKLLDPVAMTEVDNRQNEVDVNTKETHKGSDPLPHYSIIKRKDEAVSTKTDKYPIIYSEVELRETISKDGQSDRVTTDKFKAATETHTTKPDVYAAVKKPTGTVSKVPTPQDDGGLTLIENDLYGMTDNSTKEITAETPTYLLVGTVSTTPSPQDGEGLTVIENDLYCH